MKLSRYLIATLFLGVMLVLSSTSVKAQSVIITIDENGNGTFLNTGSGASGALPFGTFQDPGPGGLSQALTYSLLSPPSLIAGDLIILDSPGVISDILRFNPQQNFGSMVLYSIPGGGQLADTGFPSAFYFNTFSINEGAGLTTYTPTAGQPGFISGVAVTYRIFGSQTEVPEPASLILLGSGVAVAFLRRRMRSGCTNPKA